MKKYNNNTMPLTFLIVDVSDRLIKGKSGTNHVTDLQIRSSSNRQPTGNSSAEIININKYKQDTTLAKEEEFQKHLLKIGLMSEVPELYSHTSEEVNDIPIKIKGEPISKIMTRERR